MNVSHRGGGSSASAGAVASRPEGLAVTISIETPPGLSSGAEPERRYLTFTREIRCPLCRTSLAEVVPETSGVEDRETAIGTFDIVRCRACDTGVTSPQPLAETVPLLYGDRDTRDYDSPGTWLGNLRTTIVQRRLARAIAKRYRPELAITSVLDVGTGSGRSINGFADAFPAARCVASDFPERRPASLRPRVAYRPYGAPVPADERFDVIVMRHVLEHVLDPVGEVRALVARLAPGGLLFIEVPDSKSLIVRLAGTRLSTRFYYLPRHLNHFSFASLTRLATLAAPACLASVARCDFITVGPLLEEWFGTTRKSYVVNLFGLLLFPLQIAFERLTRSSGALTLVLTSRS